LGKEDASRDALRWRSAAPRSPAVSVNLPEPDLLFARFTQDARTVGGARAEFELFVLDLVKAQMPEAGTVRGKGGRDWGIDVLVGTFTSGKLSIWQCKFFVEWTDEGPQRQVRASFNSAVKYASEQGYTIGTWTLVVPCGLAPDQRKWFDEWAARQRRKHKIAIDIWDGFAVRHQLLRPDVAHVRQEYFPDTMPPGDSESLAVAAVAETTDLAQFDDALFVWQLHEAGETETDAARGLFYATDALVRDFEAKHDRRALDALKELHLDVQQVWSHGFSAEQSTADERGRMAGLHRRVMNEAGARPNPVGLNLRPVHKMGAVHRLVEDARAGWVTHWRDVVTAHRGTSEAGIARQPATQASPPGSVSSVARGEVRPGGAQ
jgi:hypothetical protein